MGRAEVRLAVRLGAIIAIAVIVLALVGVPWWLIVFCVAFMLTAWALTLWNGEA